MASFDRPFNHIIITEGGYVDHPLDRGGPTKYGITLGAYEGYMQRNVSAAEIKKLTIEDARKFYLAVYWRPLRLEEFPDRLALCLFDQAVNRGAFSAVAALQHVIEASADGMVGPETLSKVRALNEDLVLWAFLSEALRSYARIVQRMPSQAVFVQGWTNRVLHLIELTLIRV